MAMGATSVSLATTITRCPAYACPPITTVAQNYDEIGRISMEILLNEMADGVKSSGSAIAEQRILLSAERLLRSSA
jgi:DNA-binding LacI/PurR family transcriptional regulator